MYTMVDLQNREIIGIILPKGMDVSTWERKLMALTVRVGSRYQAGKITREKALAKMKAGEEKLGVFRCPLTPEEVRFLKFCQTGRRR